MEIRADPPQGAIYCSEDQDEASGGNYLVDDHARYLRVVRDPDHPDVGKVQTSLSAGGPWGDAPMGTKGPKGFVPLWPDGLAGAWCVIDGDVQCISIYWETEIYDVSKLRRGKD